MTIQITQFARILMVVLPIAVSASAGIYVQNEREIAAIEAAIAAKAATTMGAIDRQVTSEMAVLQAVASIRSIEEGDMERLNDTLHRILRSQQGWLSITISDGTGVVAGAPHVHAPASVSQIDPETIAEVMEHGQPVISGIHRFGWRGEPFYIVYAPIAIAGPVHYVICAKIAAWTLHDTLGEFLMPDGGRISVLDQQFRVLARSESEDSKDPLLGTESSPTVKKGAETPGALFTATPREGQPVYGVAATHPGTGWRVLVTMPRGVLDAPRVRMIQIESFGIILGIAFAFAFGISLLISHDRKIKLERQNAKAMIEAEHLIAAERLQNAFAAGRIGAYERDIQTDTVSLDARAQEILGFTDGAGLQFQDFMERIHPQDRNRVSHSLKRARNPDGNGTLHLDFRFLCPNGTIRWVSMRGSVVFGVVDGRKQPLRFISALVDISGLKAAEGALRESEERLRLSADLAGFGTFEADHAGEIRIASAQLNDIFGLPHGRRISVSLILRLVHPEDRAEVKRFRAQCIAEDGDDEMHLAFRIKRPDGAVRALDMRVRVFRTRDFGQCTITRVIGAVRDVTERREYIAALARSNAELEQIVTERTEQLLHSQKLEAIGRLTSGVAHDFNNVLQGVSSCFGALERRVVDPQSRRLFDAAQQGIQRGARLTQHLLAFARRQSLNPKPTRMDDMLDNMRPILERSMGGLISITVNVESGTWPAQVDPTQIELAVLNLAINARDAMPLGGMLTLSAKNTVITQAGDNGAPIDLAPGEYVTVTVTDTGCGMDDATVARVFEPFFTTKEVGKGSGLGLSMVHGMAAQSGGSVSIKSTLGAWTSVSIYLPRGADVESEVSCETTTPPVGIGGRILVVDDDTLVRFGTSAVLTDAGYEVIEADSAYDALKFLRDDVVIDAMLTDYAMPGMSGAMLVKEAHDLVPDMPVLMMTGYAEQPDEVGEIALLKKPFKPDDLLSALAPLVEAGRTKNVVNLMVA